ncbi:30S ribosomal protein S20 [bacterium]|nr:30S ribosomal protein S20 [bacterium]MBU1615240.1 30S ribosomal protein S20 [bacterium]
MPSHKSAKKRMKQDKKRNLSNKSLKSEVRTSIKKLSAEIEGKNLEEAKVSLNKTVSLLDKAAKKELIHKNAASRKKAQLTKKIKQIAA